MTAVALAMLAVIIALYAALRGLPPELEQLPPEQELPAPQPPAEAPAISAPTVQPDAEVESGRVPPANPEATDQPKSGAVPADELPAPAVAAPARPRPKPATAIPPARPVEEKIPEDLRRDIDAFKDEVRRERSGAKPKGKAAAQDKKAQAKVPPQELRLPSDVKKRLPAFIMSVHVYDKDPAKRFVLINALKHREGERSREGVTVEEILPDGAVLSFEGHSFFQER